jgi:hypothetical protein
MLPKERRGKYKYKVFFCHGKSLQGVDLECRYARIFSPSTVSFVYFRTFYNPLPPPPKKNFLFHITFFLNPINIFLGSTYTRENSETRKTVRREYKV